MPDWSFSPYEQAVLRAEKLLRARNFGRAERLLRGVLEHDPASVDERVLSLCAQACLQRVLTGSGDWSEVEGLLQRAMSLPGLSPASYSTSLSRLGIVYYHQGRFDTAITAHRQALHVLPQSIETRVIRNRVRGNLAEALRSSDDPEAASYEYHKVMEQLDPTDDLHTQGALYLGLALTDYDRRRDDLAVQRAVHAQNLFNHLGDPLLAARAGLHLGYFLLSQNLLEPATEAIYGSLQSAESGDDPTLRFLSRYHLAMLSFQRHAYTEPERLALAAHHAARCGGLDRYLVQSATLLAEVALLLGDHETAITRWLEAGQLCEQLRLMQRAGQIWQKVGMVLSEQGNLVDSQRFMRRALDCLHIARLPATPIGSR